MAKNQYQSALDKAEASLERQYNAWRNIDKEILSISKNARKVTSEGFDSIFPKDLEERLKKNKVVGEQLNAVLKEQARLEKSLNAAIAKRNLASGNTNKGLIKQRYETQQINKEAKRMAIISSTLSTEYQKQSARLLQMKDRYKDLAAKKSQNIKLTKAEEVEFKKLGKETVKLDNNLKRIDKSVGDGGRQVGLYGKAWAGAGKLMRAAFLAFGVTSALQIGREIFNTVKELDGLNKALKQVTETAEGYVQAKIFVKELSEEAGVEILGLQRAYTKFAAAAKTTNLTIAETQNIFRQTAKAGAVLGLSTDDINGSMRALEQILSKGKVQAEEIRGQLGERLPGAFQILARSMGLTTAELSKQLELGNVLSEEVLPAFADELAKTYSLDNIDRVETLTASQNRLSNTWVEFIETLDGSGGTLTKIFGKVLDFFTLAIDGLIALNKTAKELNDELVGSLETKSQSKELERLTKNAEKLGTTIKEEAEISKKANTLKLAQLKEEISLNEKIISQKPKIFDGSLGSRERSELNKKVQEAEQNNKNLNYQLSVQKGIRNALNSVLDENTEKVKENNKASNNGIKAIEGSIKYYQQLIAKEKETRDATAKTTEAYREHNFVIADLEKKIEDLVDKREKQVSINDKLKKSIDDIIKAEKAQRDAAKKELESLNPELATETSNPNQKNRQKELDEEAEALERQEAGILAVKNALGGLAAEFGISQDAFQTLFDGIKDGFEDIGDAAIAFGDVLGDVILAANAAERERTEQQIERLNLRRDVELENAQGNDRELRRINIQYDNEQNKLRNEQAKKDHQASIFKATIDGIAAVVNALADGGPVYAAVVGVIAAAQVAIIASKKPPKFKDGHLSGTHEGAAIINDAGGSNYQEIVERGDGTLQLYKERNAPIYMDKGDKVHKAGTFNNKLLRDTTLLNVLSQGNEVNAAQVSQMVKVDVSAQIGEQVSKALSKQKFPTPKSTDYFKLARAQARQQKANMA